MKKVIVFLSDGFEMIEALTPVDYLRRAKVEVTTVLVPGEKTDPKNPLLVTSSHNVKMFADISLEKLMNLISENQNKIFFDCVFCPGGMAGSENLSKNNDVLNIIQNCLKENKIVSAICAAPALVLSKTDALKSRKWTCYPGMQTEVLEKEIQDEYISGVPFVSDKNVVTGAGAGASEQFAMELVRLLCGNEVFEDVRKKTVQR